MKKGNKKNYNDWRWSQFLNSFVIILKKETRDTTISMTASITILRLKVAAEEDNILIIIKHLHSANFNFAIIYLYISFRRGCL